MICNQFSFSVRKFFSKEPTSVLTDLVFDLQAKGDMLISNAYPNALETKNS
jgi:hypothetical protein